MLRERRHTGNLHSPQNEVVVVGEELGKVIEFGNELLDIGGTGLAVAPCLRDAVKHPTSVSNESRSFRTYQHGQTCLLAASGRVR